MLEAGGFRERGVSGALAWDPDRNSALGWSFSLGHAAGTSARGGMGALLRPDTARALAADDAGDAGDDFRNRRLEAKLGYGIPLASGRMVGTPEVGLELSNASHEVSLGSQAGLARREGLFFDIRVETVRRGSLTGDAAPRTGSD